MEKKNYIIPASVIKNYFSETESNSLDQKSSNVISNIDVNVNSFKETKNQRKL